MNREERVPLVVPPAAVVVLRRPGQWRRETVAMAVAGALLLVVAMASLSGIRSSQNVDADFASLAAKMRPVMALKTPAEARARWEAPPSANTWAARSHRQVMISAKKMHKAALAPSKISSLAEYMKDKSPHHFPLLAASEVKRAMACPQNSICSFEGDSTMSMYTHVEEYDPVKEVKHSDTQTKTDLKVWFDVFETNHMGCIHGHVAYGINITKVQTSPAEVHEHSDDKGDVDKKFEGQLGSDGENEMMMRALTANTFTFVQDSVTGHYVDFVVPDHELEEVVNTKRSLVNGLNPVINVANQDKAVRREDGSLLFQMAFRGMNGFQRTVYSIKHHPTEEGTHEIQHHTILIQEEGGGEQVNADDEENVDGDGQSGQEKDNERFNDENIKVEEPESCPFQVPTKETQIGKASGTAQVKGRSVTEETNDADMKVGQDAAKGENPRPSQNAGVDEKEQGQEPVKGDVSLVATYQAKRLAVKPYMSPCSSSLAAPQVGNGHAPMTMTLAGFKQEVPRAGKKASAKPVDGELGLDAAEDEDDTSKLVRRSFTTPLLVEDKNEDYKGNMDVPVQALVESITSNPTNHLRPSQANDLRDACDHGAFRRGVLAYLRDKTVKVKPQYRVAVQFLGACEGSASKKGTQEDLVALAKDEKASKHIRMQALMSMADIKCPLMSTLSSLHELSHHKTPVGYNAMLILGALLRSSRQCTKTEDNTHARTEVEAMERGLNAKLHEALKDGRHTDATTILYAMSNSGADHHFHTIKTAMRDHSLVLRSIDLQLAALTAVQSVGYVSTGKPNGGPEHQQLMEEISDPLDPAKDFAEELAGNSTTALSVVDGEEELAVSSGMCSRAGQANIFCYSKRLPERSTVNTLNEIQLGLGQAIDGSKKCVKYADAQGKAHVEVNTGIPIPGMDPLTIPVLDIQGQFFFKKTGKKLGGNVKLLGWVVYSFGNELLEPCVNQGGPDLNAANWFGMSVHEPPSWYGFCGFDSTAFDGITKEKSKHWAIPVIHGRFYMVGPVRLSIYAYLVLQWSGGLTIQGEDRYWKLKDEAKGKPECQSGGFAGNLMNEIFVRIDIGGEASVGIFKARLGLEIKVFNVEARGTGELLPKGFGKEVNFELSSLSGAIVAKLYSWVVHCWWGGCLARVWGRCVWRALHCSSGYNLLWGTTLWSWAPAWTSGNLFCRKPTLHCRWYWWYGWRHHCWWSGWGPTFGCPVFVSSPIAEILHNIMGYVCLSGATTCGVDRFRKRYIDKEIDVGKGSRLYLIPAEHKQALIDGPAKTQSLQSAATNDFEQCDYIQASSYRGFASNADGQTCLPWPKGSVARYKGEGLAYNAQECDDLPEGSVCWDACVAQMETNNYCRAPDDTLLPYCRTGGTDEAPVYSKCTQLKKCKEKNGGCTHNRVNAEDYSGPVSWTASGKKCDTWVEYEQYRNVADTWQNGCRNPRGEKKTAWCLVKASPQGWEYCDVGIACDDAEASQQINDEVNAEGEQIAREDWKKRNEKKESAVSGQASPAPPPAAPTAAVSTSTLPKQGLYAHFTATSYQSISKVWQDASGNGRHSILAQGDISVASGPGFGAPQAIDYLVGDETAVITFPEYSIPDQFTICSLSRYGSNDDMKRILLAADDNNWFHGHALANAGVARYDTWMTNPSNSVIKKSDWLVMCGQNGDRPILLANGQEVQISATVTGGKGGKQLGINKAGAMPGVPHLGNSDWQVAAITIWNRVLSEDEIWLAYRTYAKYLGGDAKALDL